MSDSITSRVVLPGVDRYRVMDPWFEGLRILINYSGEKYSPAYVQGIGGTAFKTGGPCPCAPTNDHRMEPDKLARVFGFEVERIAENADRAAVEAGAGELVERVKREIRAGRPVLLWHGFTMAEWDVVTGFDDVEKIFYGRGTYRGNDEYAVEPEQRFLTCFDFCPMLGALFLGEKTCSFDADLAEREALEWAVQHARTPSDRLCCPPGEVDLPGEVFPPWRFRNGIGCYEWWANAYRSAPDTRVPDFGERYCLGVYSSTHLAGANFCRELAQKYPAPARDAFTRAAAAMDEDAANLRALLGLLFPGWQVPQSADVERSIQAAELLTKAQAAYTRAIDEIESALHSLN